MSRTGTQASELADLLASNLQNTTIVRLSTITDKKCKAIRVTTPRNRPPAVRACCTFSTQLPCLGTAGTGNNDRLSCRSRKSLTKECVIDRSSSDGGFNPPFRNSQRVHMCLESVGYNYNLVGQCPPPKLAEHALVKPRPLKASVSLWL